MVEEISGVLTILSLPIALLLRHVRNRPGLLRPFPGLAIALTGRLVLSRRRRRCRPGAPAGEFILDLGRLRVWRLGEGVGKALRRVNHLDQAAPMSGTPLGGERCAKMFCSFRGEREE